MNLQNNLKSCKVHLPDKRLRKIGWGMKKLAGVKYRRHRICRGKPAWN